MGKLQKTRGDSCEREIATYLTSELGVDVKRKLGQARDSGEDISVPPFRIEVKRRRKVAVTQFIEQCELGSAINEIPIVIIRTDGDKRPLVMLRLDQFIGMMRSQIENSHAIP